MRVWWRGVLLDDRTRDMMVEVARTTGSVYVRPTQGSFNRGGVAASAGTHDGCGAIDIGGNPGDMDMIVDRMRRVGFAAWHRTPAQSNWPHHVHGIAVQPGGKWDQGCLSRGAAAQIVDYYNGLNGLAGRGRDDGPRHSVGVTWEQYQRQRGDWFDMADKNDLRDVVRGETRPLRQQLERLEDRLSRMEGRQTRTDRAVGGVRDQMRVVFARQRKMYRKIIEREAGYQVGEMWRPTDDPLDPGYEPDEPLMASEVLARNGWPEEEIPVALAVAWLESGGGYADAVGDLNIIDDVWGPSVGLFQYRTMRTPPTSGYLPDTYRDIDKLRDVDYQAEAARALWEARGWGQWSVWRPDEPRFRDRVGVDFPIRTGHGKADCWSLDGCP